MPAINKISSLEGITGEWIIKWLLDSNIKSSNGKVQIRNYAIKHLNANIRQKLLTNIFDLHIYTLELTLKCLFLEVLGDGTTTSVDMTKSGSVFIEEAFHLYCILAKSDIKNLSRFGIDCSLKTVIDRKYINEVNDIFCHSLNQMKNLRWVTLRGLGEPLLLQILGSSCPYLEYLDVKDSLLVNDAGVMSLLFENPEEVITLPYAEVMKYTGPTNPCCLYLSFLGVSGTDVGFMSIFVSLVFLPNLYSYGGYIYQSSVSKVFSHLKSNEELKPFKLIEFWDDDISVEQAITIGKLCPSLSSLSTNMESVGSLLSLSNFSVTTLILDCDFKNCEYELSDFLYIRGSTLTHLSLKQGINTKVNILTLIECTPSLKEIQLPLHLNDELENKLEKWSYLEKAVVSVNSVACLKVFLTHSPVLSNLNLKFVPEPYAQETCDAINDDFVIDVCSRGALSNLEYLSLEDCGIGVVGLEALLLNCTKLKYLEKLFYWKNVKSNHLSELRKKIRNLNWNLKVVLKEKYCDMNW